MDSSLSGVVVVLSGQAPDIEPFRSFHRELEKRVLLGDISVVWLDGGPLEEPLFATTKANQDTQFQDRLYPPLTFSFQNTLGFHEPIGAFATPKSNRDAKIENIRVLQKEGTIKVVGITLPYSDDAYKETQRRVLSLNWYFRDEKKVLLEILPAGFILPAGRTMPTTSKFRNLCSTMSANYYWNPVEYTNIPEFTGQIPEGLIRVRRTIKDDFYRKENQQLCLPDEKWDDGTNYTFDFSERIDSKILDLLYNRLFVSQEEVLPESEAELWVKQKIAIFLGEAASMNFGMPTIDDLTVLESENHHGIFATLDLVVKQRQTGRQQHFDFSTIPIGDLSETIRLEVEQATQNVSNAEATLRSHKVAIGELRVSLEELYDERAGILDEFTLRELALSEREQALEQLLTDLKEREALYKVRVETRRTTDTELIQTVAEILNQLELHKDGSTRKDRRLRKAMGGQLLALVFEHNERFSQLAMDASANNIENHILADGIILVLTRKAIDLANLKIGLLSSVSELDGTRFLSSLTKQIDPDTENWFLNLGKFLPQGTTHSVTKYLMTAAFAHVEETEMTMRELLNVLQRIQFEPQRAVLDPATDMQYQIGQATPNALGGDRQDTLELTTGEDTIIDLKATPEGSSANRPDAVTGVHGQNVLSTEQPETNSQQL